MTNAAVETSSAKGQQISEGFAYKVLNAFLCGL